MSKITDYRTEPNKNQGFNLDGKIKVKLMLFFASVVAFLIFVQLVYAGNLAVDGQKLANVDDQIKKLEEENTTLRVEIAQETSLASLSQKAYKLGFDKPKKLIETN